jgi:anti-sigma-K factor RskA
MIHKPGYVLEKVKSHTDVIAIDESLFSHVAVKGNVLYGDPEKAGFSLKSVLSIGSSEQGGEIIWLVQSNNATVGVVWINTDGTGDLQAPSLHFAVAGDENTAYAVAKDAIRYAYCNLPYATLYSRHDATNGLVGKLDKRLGFEKDSDTYQDEQGQVWQNIALVL